MYNIDNLTTIHAVSKAGALIIMLIMQTADCLM